MKTCTSCGFEAEESKTNCPRCGNELVNGSNEESEEKSSGSKVITTLVVLAVIGVIIYLVINKTSLGDSIKSKGASSIYLNDFSKSKTVGEAFDDFFADPSWSSYTSNGNDYAKFTGDCTYNGSRVQVKIIFSVDEDWASVDTAYMGGYELSYYDIVSLLNTVYDG